VADIDPNAWMISFSDLLTLLLTFFVLIFTMSSANNKAVKEAFGFFSAAYGPLELGSSPAPYPPKNVKELKQFTSQAVLPPGALVNEAFGSFLDFGRPRTAHARMGKYEAAGKLRAAIKDSGYTLSEIQVRMSGSNLLVRLGERFLFDSGKAALVPEALPLLTRLGKIIKKTPFNVRVEGHTDDVPIHTSLYASNWELSVARAVNVLRYLIKADGIAPERLSAGGYGATHPISKKKTPEARALNRRVEIIITTKGKGVTNHG